MQSRRASKADYLHSAAWASGLLCAVCCLGAGNQARAADATPVAPDAQAAAPPPPANTPPILLTPSVGLQEAFTDNVRLTSTDRQSDWVTRAMLELDGSVDDGPTVANFEAQGFYDLYARTSSFDGFSVNAFGSGSFSVVKGFLTIDAAGTATDGNVSTFGTSAIDRSGTAGQNPVRHLQHWSAPHDHARLSVADVEAVARFGQVLYSAASQNTAQIPSNANMLQVASQGGHGQSLSRLPAPDNGRV